MLVKVLLSILVLQFFFMGSKSIANSPLELSLEEREAGQSFVNIPLNSSDQQQTKEKAYRAIAQGYVSQALSPAQRSEMSGGTPQNVASTLQFAEAFSKLGYFAESINEFDASIGFYKRAIAILSQAPPERVAYAYGDNIQRISRVYHDAAVFLESQRKIKESLVYFQKALEIFNMIGPVAKILSSEMIGDRYLNTLRHLQPRFELTCKWMFSR